MKERSFDEMVAYFNRRVSEMDIAHNYKTELLGMVTALGYKHEQTAQRWIPCSDSERLPKETGKYLITEEDGEVCVDTYLVKHNEWYECFPIAWMPLPEPYREGEE